MKSQSISTLKELFKAKELTESHIKELRTDSRKGVEQLLRSYDKKQEEKKELEKKFEDMWTFEKELHKKQYKFIAGTDEAGRGPLAGPVVAASVILPKDFNVIGITDSKQLTEKDRNYFFEKIKEKAIDYSIYSIDHQEIDRINILEATKKAMEKSLLDLKRFPDYALIDAVNIQGTPFPVKSIIKGDDLSISIAAASILAKVTRDQVMEQIAKEYPEYGFDKHKGYGTKEHIEILQKLGPTPYHRYSFTPIKKLLES